MQSEMEVVGSGVGVVSTRDDVKTFINKDVTLDGHRMVFKSKVFNDKKSTMTVYLQCQYWRTTESFDVPNKWNLQLPSVKIIHHVRKNNPPHST